MDDIAARLAAEFNAQKASIEYRLLITDVFGTDA
ncbi:hypothetical protein FHT79_001011 [Rhizobium sp. BK212]|nr:hypothetical protein [Rhizobium sp. BK212]